MQASPYQNDLFVLVLGEAAAKDMEEGLRCLAVEKMGIDLNYKDDSSQPFDTVFGAKVAPDDTLDMSCVTLEPAKSFLQKASEVVDSFVEWSWKEVPRKALQRCMGFLQFASASFEDGAFWVNSDYANLAAQVGSTEQNICELAPSTAEFCKDTATVVRMLRERDSTGLIDNPMIRNPEIEGANTDATASSNVSKRGWSATIFCK